MMNKILGYVKRRLLAEVALLINASLAISFLYFRNALAKYVVSLRPSVVLYIFSFFVDSYIFSIGVDY